MLSYVRKYAYSWQMKTVYVLIALTFFGGFGIASYLKSCTFVMDPYTVARIDGESVSLDEFQQAYSNALNALRERLGEKFSEDMVRDQRVRTEVLRGVIQRTLVMRRARDLGIGVSDDELRMNIARLFSDEKGRFDPERYRNALRANRLRVAQFEEGQREEILLSKVQEMIASNVFLSEDEIAEDYRLKNEKVNLTFWVFDSPSEGKPSDKARSAAQSFLVSLASGRTPRSAPGESTGFFSRKGDMIPGIGFSPEAVRAAFSLTKAHPVADTPLLIDGKYYVIRLKARKDIVPTQFAGDKEEFARELLKEKRQRVLHNWLSSLVQGAHLTINDQLLETMGERRGGE